MGDPVDVLSLKKGEVRHSEVQGRFNVSVAKRTREDRNAEMLWYIIGAIGATSILGHKLLQSSTLMVKK